jgi:hypothetical protein
MPSENNPEVQYELFEDKKAIKFMDNHSDDEKLIKRIYDKYSQLSINPYKEAESSFKSKNVRNVKKNKSGQL